MRPEELLQEAALARVNAYAPYSGFLVGAALETADGIVFRGCNIENSSFGATNCAERTALFSAIAAGHRSFSALAVVGAYQDGRAPEEFCPPCGICRQVLAEFCSPGLPVYLQNGEGTQKTLLLKDLLPEAFEL